MVSRVKFSFKQLIFQYRRTEIFFFYLISLPQVNRRSPDHVSVNDQSVVNVNEESKSVFPCHSFQFNALQFGSMLHVCHEFLTLCHSIIVHPLFKKKKKEKIFLLHSKSNVYIVGFQEKCYIYCIYRTLKCSHQANNSIPIS